MDTENEMGEHRNIVCLFTLCGTSYDTSIRNNIFVLLFRFYPFGCLNGWWYRFRYCGSLYARHRCCLFNRKNGRVKAIYFSIALPFIGIRATESIRLCHTEICYFFSSFWLCDTDRFSEFRAFCSIFNPYFMNNII